MKNKQLWKNNDNKFILQSLNQEFFQKTYIISVYPDTLDYKNVRYLCTPTRIIGRSMSNKRYTILGLAVFVRSTFFKSTLFNISQSSFLHTFKKIKPIAFWFQNLLSKSNVRRTNVLSIIKKVRNKRVVKFNSIIGTIPSKFTTQTMYRVNSNLTKTQSFWRISKLNKQMFNRINIKKNFSLRKIKIFKKTKFRKRNQTIFKFVFKNSTDLKLKN